MQETMNDTYLRLYCSPLRSWHTGRRSRTIKQINTYLNYYYQARQDESTRDSAIVIGSIIAGIVLIVTAIFLNHA